MKKLLSVLFAVMILSLILTGCGEKKETATSDSDSQKSTSSENSSKSEKENQKKEEVKEKEEEKEPEIPKELSDEEAFEQTLIAMMGKYREMGKTGGFNLIDAFGLPKEVMSYPFLETSVDVTNDEDKTPSTLKQLSINNGTDAVEKIDLIDKEGTLSSAVYFTGDTMLLRVADLSKPLYQYTLPAKGDGKLLEYLSPMNRYMVCITSDTPGETYGHPWEESMSMISFRYKDSGAKVKVDTKSLSAASINEEAKSYIIELEGEPAADLFFTILSPLSYDYYAKQLTTTADNVALDEGDQSSTFSLMDIYMNPENMKLKLEVCTVNNFPAALFLNAESKGGTAVIELTSLQKDKDKAERLVTTFTHLPAPYLEKDKLGGYTTVIENTLTKEEQVCTQIVTSPKGKEKYKYETKNTITGTEDDRSSKFQIHFKSKDFTFDSKGDYSHKKSGTSLDGSFTGKTTVVQKHNDKKETTKSEFKGSLVADEKGREIEMPEIVEGSVVKVSSREELSKELFPDLESAGPFNYIETKSPIMQYMNGYMVLTYSEQE